MTSSPPTSFRPLPRWVIVGGSGLIAFHLLALGMLVLAAPSGPWITNFGPSQAGGPPFAGAINEVTGRHYLRPLHMENDYHFTSNVAEMPSVYFEVRLKDGSGKVLKTLKFPDDKANFWVRHRQRLLAQGLGNDQPFQAPQGEKAWPEDYEGPSFQLWLGTANATERKLTKVTEKRLPRDGPQSRPSNWSLLLAQAYARHLCREHGAASAELVRHSRNAILPDILFFDKDAPLPREAFSELVCNYGDYRP